VKKAIQVDEKDNVATITDKAVDGEKIQILNPEALVILEIKILNKIYFGHKIALQDFKIGDKIIKYGKVIGVASNKIKRGEWVHVHNMESSRLPTSRLRF
jgi:altronate dehydratase